MKYIIVAKKNDFLRQRMVWALNQSGYTKISQAHDATDLIKKVKSFGYDLIILERGLGKELGIKQLRKIKKQNETIRFIMINPNGTIEKNYKKNLMAIGVKAFISNDPPTKLLIDTVVSVLSGQRVRKSKRKK